MRVPELALDSVAARWAEEGPGEAYQQMLWLCVCAAIDRLRQVAARGLRPFPVRSDFGSGVAYLNAIVCWAEAANVPQNGAWSHAEAIDQLKLVVAISAQIEAASTPEERERMGRFAMSVTLLAVKPWPADKGRPLGSRGYKEDDDKLVDELDRRISAGRKPWTEAKALAEVADGSNSTIDSRAKRLVRLWKGRQKAT